MQLAKHEQRDRMIKEICWDKSVIETVWKKGRIKPDYSPNVLRWDDSGRMMMWSKYGRTDSRFGWTIEVKDPNAEGGAENLDNLHPVCIYTHRDYL